MMSVDPGQKRVLDHEEIFGEIVSELNESDESAESPPAVESAAPQAETAPAASPALVPAVEDSPGEAEPEDGGESLPAANPPAEEEPAAVSSTSEQATSAPIGDREVACWVDTTLSLVHRSAARAASQPGDASRPQGRIVESVDAPAPEGATATESPAGATGPPEALAAGEPAASGEAELANAPLTDEESAGLEDEGSERFAGWRIFLVAILVGLLAGVLAAFLTTRLLHGSWLPRPPAGVVSQTTEDYRTMLETPLVATSEARQGWEYFYTPLPGEAPADSVERL